MATFYNRMVLIFSKLMGRSWKISPDRSGYTICSAGFAALAKWYL